MKPSPLPWPDLIASHTEYVRYIAGKFTRDEEDALDLAQDVLVRVLSRQHLFDGRTLKGWLFRVMRNVYIDHHQKKARWPHDVERSELMIEGRSEFGSVGNTAESNLATSEVRAMIATLTEVQQQVMELRIQGHKYREIAVALNVPIGTVRSALHRSREILSDYLIK